MFEIGQKIYYPMHGAGVIKNIEDKEILGETQTYYTVELQGNITVLFPKQNAQKLGIRPIIEQEKAQEVLDNLLDSNITPLNGRNERFEVNRQKIKQGDPLEVASVYKELSLRNRRKNLSTSEKKMLSNARAIVMSEVATSTNKNYTALIDEMEYQFDKMFDSFTEVQLEMLK